MNNNIKTVKNLSLTVGIISVVLAVPLLGVLVNVLHLPTIATIVLAIIILVKSKDTGITATASILSIISGCLGAVGFLFSDWGGMIIFAGWILLILAAIFHFINVSKLNKMAAQTFDSVTVVETPTETVIIEEQVTITTDQEQPTV